MERGSEALRKLDRWLGVPLIFSLGLLRRKRRWRGGQPKRVGILISAAIGDTIVFSAVLNDLKAAYPHCHCTVFCGPSNHAIFSLIPQVDEVVKLPVTNPLVSARMIRAHGRFDLWIDTGQWMRVSALLTWAARSCFSVGFRTQGQGRHWIYDLAVEHSASVHEVENFRRLIQFLGVSATGFPSIDMDGLDKGHVVVHAFAGGTKPYLKEWPRERWVSVIDGLTGQNRVVYLTGIGADAESAEAIRSDCGHPERVISVAGKLSFVETAQLLKDAGVVISVNTGILHLAAALGCDVIGLHGPTSPVRWGPLSARGVVVSSRLDCAPCLNLGFDYGCSVNRCMQAISANEVLRPALSILASKQHETSVSATAAGYPR